MKEALEKLRLVAPAEVESKLAVQKAVVTQMKTEVALAEVCYKDLQMAAHCHKIGIWPGDRVRVNGQFHGKLNPEAELVGFNFMWNKPAALVRLFRKDGTASANTVEAYSNSNTIAKAE